MKLCINADDFGYSSEIDRGILEAVQKGLVTSCSVMARSVDRESLRLLSQYNVSIGLHLTLTGQEDYHLAASPMQLLAGVWRGTISKGMIADEIEKQFSMLQPLMEAPITHIDTHQHVHIIPLIYRLAEELCDRHTINYLRIPWEASREKSFKKTVLNTFFQKPGVGPAFWGTGFMGRRFTTGRIVRQLNYLEDSNIPKSIWMVHVGYETKTGPMDRYNSHRENDLLTLYEVAEELKSRCTLIPITHIA